MSAAGRQARPGPGGRTKSGKPRPGTGGYGKRRLEGKGPTPPAQLRPGHPAQRRAAGAAGPAGQAAARGTSRGSTGPAPAGRYTSKSRSPGGTEMVAGRNAVLESLRAAVPATALHVGPRLDADDRISEAITLAADARIPVVEAGRDELDRITGGAVHQGLALRVRPYAYAHPDDLLARAAEAGEQPLIVALDGVTDPRNLGAVVRSVAAFGGHGVLVPVRRSAGVTAGAWKASAGALARVPVAQAANLVRVLAGYQEAGLFIAGLDGGGGTPISELELADSPLVLVVGSEGRGLSRLVAQRCDVLTRIPISAAAQSLNAGVAASIALYEVARARSASAR
jgi:23S rRNA (guanosine2251-2'-O)-methyltransferase